jgi:hypothetical protein
MKKLLSLLLIAGSLLLVSCSSDSPKTVVEKFTKAMSEGDYATAKKYADKQTVELLGALEAMAKISPEEVAKTTKETKELYKSFEVTKVEENGDTAKVYTKTAQGEGETYDLKKEDGKWRVSMKKEGM